MAAAVLPSVILRRWLVGFAVLVGIMVLVGGFVRLTRSGLSIVEWNPISGAIPPLTDQAWQEEFAKYQQTPEYQKVNRGMTLDEYRYIFWIEWIHRQLARAIGLYFALPFLWFWVKGRIPTQHRGKFCNRVALCRASGDGMAYGSKRVG